MGDSRLLSSLPWRKTFSDYIFNRNNEEKKETKNNSPGYLSLSCASLGTWELPALSRIVVSSRRHRNLISRGANSLRYDVHDVPGLDRVATCVGIGIGSTSTAYGACASGPLGTNPLLPCSPLLLQGIYRRDSTAAMMRRAASSTSPFVVCLPTERRSVPRA